jgi:type II restriction/modification system DNA methylase subunit YeeA
MNPTLNFQVGNVANIPTIELPDYSLVCGFAEQTIAISRQDWDNFETSWDFQTHPLLRYNTPKLSEALKNWETDSKNAFQQLKQLEEENNKYWIEAYGLQDEITPEVPDKQITIRRADQNRDIRSFISYAVGCMMGRYSLDQPGLIHAGQPFDPTQHTIFPADIDAIIPITDQAYFDDDIVNRFVEFIRVAYSPETLTENLDFIADTLTRRSGETSRDRIRRYFLTEFISDHIQTYKKRPIYWLFTSGKNRAFNALVYLHRYKEDTLARLRTDYVLEQQVKLDGETARTQQQFDNATNSVAKKAATKRLKELQTQQLELRDYQAKLQTMADARIKLDLDDGVAYNYTRFKGLVYEGSDLKMADLEKAAQWKLELLKVDG